MRKRLRKKKCRREFKVWGTPVLVRLRAEADYDGFLWRFLEEAIEANDCFCGGGGRRESMEFFVELGRTAEEPKARLAKIVAWLDACEDVTEHKVGKLTDACYGPFEDLSEDGCDETM